MKNILITSMLLLWACVSVNAQENGSSVASSTIVNKDAHVKFEYCMVVHNAQTNEVIVFIKNEEKYKYNVTDKTVFAIISTTLNQLGNLGWQMESSNYYLMSHSLQMPTPANGVVIYLSRQVKE